MSFAELYAFAAARLPDPLRRLRVPAVDVGDVIHDVVLVAHPKLARFQPRRPEDVDGSFLAWLTGIAWRRLFRQRTRASSRCEQHVGDVAHFGAAAADAATPEDLAAQREELALALRVVREIRRERAEVLVLHDVGGMTVPEIAERLSLNPNTVKSRLGRARLDVRAVVLEMNGASAAVPDDAHLGEHPRSMTAGLRQAPSARSIT